MYLLFLKLNRTYCKLKPHFNKFSKLFDQRIQLFINARNGGCNFKTDFD
jgi:hypothetical protein